MDGYACHPMVDRMLDWMLITAFILVGLAIIYGMVWLSFNQPIWLQLWYYRAKYAIFKNPKDVPFLTCLEWMKSTNELIRHMEKGK